MIIETNTTPEVDVPNASGSEAASQGGAESGNQSVDNLVERIRLGRTATRSEKASTEQRGSAQTEPTPESANDTPANAEAGNDSAEGDDGANAPDTVEDLREQLRSQREAMQKRIDRLTARIKQNRTESPDVEEGDGAEPPPRREVPTPAADKTSEQIESLEASLRWLDEHPDGGEYRDARGNVIVTVPAEQVVGLVRGAERQLARLQAQVVVRNELAQKAATEARARHDAEAARLYPWLGDPKSSEYSAALEALGELDPKTVQAFESLPNAKLLLGDLVAGRLARQRTASAKQPSASRTAPPKVLGAPGAPPRRASATDGLVRELEEAQATFAESGTADALQRVMSLEKRLRRERG